MRYSRLLTIVAILLTLITSATAGSITGVFQGRIVQLPSGKSKAKWLYVQGKNGAIRRANIANAVVEYDDDYPASKRHKRAADSLDRAIEVRVTAEQDEAKGGEWQATNILILAPRRNSQKPSRKAPDTPSPTVAKSQVATAN
ncbi:MAG: hypothetical protein JWN45_399 [Acidobacteriaceae bacterium]|nr:hypothetical protein [Acidobacteriaceae bacterium]